MNKFYKFFFIYFFIVSCGYQPIFSEKKVNFGIKNLVYDKNNKVDLNPFIYKTNLKILEINLKSEIPKFRRL